jgi:hypothetical protein
VTAAGPGRGDTHVVTDASFAERGSIASSAIAERIVPLLTVCDPTDVSGEPSPGEDVPSGAGTWAWIGVGCVISVLMRLRMIGTPVSADEGGYLAIARGWAHGRVLYRDVWVDRPQGLLVLFRAWDWLSGGSNGSLRIMAMVFGALLVAATAVVVRELAGHVAARWTALICGVLSAAPVLEAYVPNGELLSGSLSAAALAVALVGRKRMRARWWMFAAGLLAGLALSVKQSGFDGVLALLLSLGLVGLVCRDERKAAWSACCAVVAGATLIVAVLMAHGALTGWYRWWWAVAGYRAHTQSLLHNPYWTNLSATMGYGIVVLGSGLLVGVVGIALRCRRAESSLRSALASGMVLLPLWLLTASLSFVIGGGYWRHYWLLLAGPVSALAGAAVPRFGRLSVVAAAVVVAPCVAISTWVFVGDTATLSMRAASDQDSARARQVADWFIVHRRPGDDLYVMCDDAAVYADARQDPGFPYLWFPEFYAGPQARQKLLAYLGNPVSAPRFIAQFQSARSCEPSGHLGTILARSYRQVDRIGSTIILERDPARSPVIQP